MSWKNSDKERNDCKISLSRTKLIASDSDTDEAFRSMHQSTLTEIKNYVSEDWIFWCNYKDLNLSLFFMSVNELRGFFFENYYKGIGFV